jgi:hypothetical protein
MAAKEQVLLENDMVKVTRVDVPGGTKHQAPARGPRVVISLSDEAETLSEAGKGVERIRRKAGEVVFRNSSSGHTIENSSDAPHTVIIVELKSAH